MVHTSRDEDAPEGRSSAQDILDYAKKYGVVGALVLQIIGLTWWAAGEHATIQDSQAQIVGIHQSMQAENLPSRVQALEDLHKSDANTLQELQANLKETNASLQAQIKDVNIALGQQGQSLAQLLAQMQFLISRMYPETGQATQRSH